jgi:dienelactone hydrolase
MKPALQAVWWLALSSAATAQDEASPALLRRVIEMHGRQSTAAGRERSPLPPDPGRVVHLVRPRDTDPGISGFLQDHYAITYRNRPRNGRLFLFFPGTFGRPQSNQLLLDRAAQNGYLALGLEYVNTTNDPARAAVKNLCGDDPDPACAGNVRQERLWGEDASPKVAVSRADSAVNRASKALEWLQREYPGEGWGRFLTGDGSVDWARVAVGGHSQGGGMAAYLAKQVEVARVCLFSAGVDFSPAQRGFAAWLKQPGVTPAGRFYGMVHRQESGYRAIAGGYALLGLAAGSIRIVSLAPAKSVTLGGGEHGSTAVDASTPKDAQGLPLFSEVWDFVIGR